ncbi:condensation domain-containing protein [Pseudomonas helleri]|uniref:condensation domain-containing protein n=1 Tax=Pseudomonas helleri TaxID=1608996 RepID=UPI0024309848|nr:condensation domain-containing protein [Pseudomonas helleri]
MDNTQDLVYSLSLEQTRRLKAVSGITNCGNGISPYLASIAWSSEPDLMMLSKAIEGVISKHEILRSKIIFPNFSKTAFQAVLPGSDCQLESLFEASLSLTSALETLLNRWHEGGCEQAMLLAGCRNNTGERCIALLLSPIFGDLPTLRIFTRDLARFYCQLTEGQTDDQTQPLQFVEAVDFLNERELRQPQLTANIPQAVSTGLRQYGFQEKIGSQFICSVAVNINGDLMKLIIGLCSRTGVSKDAVFLAVAHKVWRRFHATERSELLVIHEGRLQAELSDACGPYAMRQCQATEWEIQNGTLEDLLTKAASLLEPKLEKCAELSQATMNLVFECGLGSNSSDFACFQLNLHAAPAATSETVIAFAESTMPSAQGSLILSGHSASTSKLALEDLGQMICAELDEWLKPSMEQGLVSEVSLERVGEAKTADLHTNLRNALREGKNNLAIKSDHREWTYDQLHCFVNSTGWRLLELGAKKERPVVLIDTVSIELIGTLCACLLLGIPFVVIDPNGPVKRRNTILAGLATPLILVAKGELLAELETAGAHAIGGGEFVKAPPLPVTSMDAAHPVYVLYTSGTTGTPKGVEIGYAALDNFLSWMGEVFTLTFSDRVLITAAPTFDVFIREVFWPLLQGAAIVLPGRQSNWLDPRILASLCAEERITHLRLVPSLMLEFVHLGVVLPSTVKRFMSGGEAVSTKLLQDFIALNPLPFCVFYGPTETTINVAFWQGEGHFTPINAPLGSPAAGAQLLILDESFKPVPWGGAGQLSVAGTPLANGYKDNAALTEESFRWLDLGMLEKTRVYLTGDRARRLPDGCYEFLGRMDDQVKLRGFRIELGEIAHALRQQKGVTDALVLADTQAAEARLIAYVVPAHRANDSTGLRESLRRELPEYMVPTAFIGVDQWPLTQNGKIDRRALPQPQAATGGNGAIPTEGLPHQLAQAWSEVLEVQHLSVEDNFFDLGGHSLLAMRLISRLRNDGLEINLRQFFDRPTIARQAEFFAQQPRDPLITAVEIPRLPREEFLPLSMTQNRLWILDQLVPGNPVYNIPLALRLTGPLQQGALVKALEAIVQRHEILRANFINDDGEPQIILRTSAALPFEDVELSADNLDELLTERARRPFDLSEDALIRATLVTLEAEHHVLLLVIHHIVFDGWSQSVLLKELAQLYSDFCNARPSSLPELAYQYIDYAQWKRTQLAEQGVLERQQRFWREKIGSAPKTFGLPTDFPRPAVQSFAGAEYVFELAEPLMRNLESLARQQQVTLFSLMLSAFAATLAQLSGRRDVVIAVPHAGRYPDSDGLIGFFVNTVLISLLVDPARTVIEQIDKAHQAAQEAFENGDLPFDLVVRTLGLAGANQGAVTDVMFTFSYMDGAPVISDALQLQAYDVTLNVAKYGLMGSFIGHPDRAQFRFEYDVQLFTPETIEHFANTFSQQLADWISSHDQSCAGDLLN